jgi:ribonuclease HII
VNKGYGTRAHEEALAKYGPCPIHRKSYAPIKRWLEEHK